MNRTAIGLWLGVVVALHGSSTYGVAQQTAFRAGTDLVLVDALVRRGNSPVTGLLAEDFEILDNGVKQHINLQITAAIPLDVTFVMDQALVSERLAGMFASGSATIATEWLRSGDRIRIISVGNDVRELVSLQAVETWTSTRKPLSAQDFMVRRHEPVHPSVFDALILAVALPPEIARRQLAIALTSGANEGAVVDGDALERVFARNESVVYVVMPVDSAAGATGSIGVSPHIEYATAALARAAKVTGGDVRNASEGVEDFKSILSNFRQAYVLSYTATGVPPSGWHTIRVTIPRHPEYRVQARTGYLGRQ
ncbi:MAG TPA: hypothetical protein VJN96_17985 [Vicinamibacterales bacterium]|nr:hypothetical protein [Vicinamibacterales bacterium]